MKCQQCGRENKDKFKFCLGCGSTLAPSEPPKSQYTGPVNEQLDDLLAQVADFEKFGLYDDAIRLMQRVCGLAPKNGTYRIKLFDLMDLKDGS